MEQQSLPCCTLVADGVLTLSDEKEQQISHRMYFDGGKLVQFHLGVFSTYSYLLCSCDAGFLIDPGRDLFNYENYIRENNIRLCGVFLTHMHSDFVAGHIEAGERFHVPVFISKDAGAGFPHITVDDDDNFSLGRLRLHFFSASGHADDCICMSAGADPENPGMLFAGDALDISAENSPDMPWLKRFDDFPDDTQVFFAHESTGDDLSWSTVGREKANNPLFNPDIPAGAKRFRHQPHLESLRHINRRGPQLVDWENVFTEAEPDPSWNTPESRVVDIRSFKDYSVSHIPRSLNIEANGKLEYWTANIFDPDSGPVILTGDDEHELAAAAARLQSVDIPSSVCIFDRWRQAGLPTVSAEWIDVQELAARLWSENQPFLLDVRSPAEWQKSRIPSAVNIPLDILAENIGKLPSDRDIVIICATGFRSAIAAGILERGAVRNASTLRGGMGAWLEEGKALEHGPAKNHTPVPSKCGMKS